MAKLTQKDFDALPRYDGLGRFEGEYAILEGLHGLTLEGGGDEEAGELETTGAYVRLDGPFTDALEDETPAERRFRKKLAGVIIHESGQGFISAEYYGTRAALEEAWARVLSDVEASEEEDDE